MDELGHELAHSHFCRLGRHWSGRDEAASLCPPATARSLAMGQITFTNSLSFHTVGICRGVFTEDDLGQDKHSRYFDPYLVLSRSLAMEILSIVMTENRRVALACSLTPSPPLTRVLRTLLKQKRQREEKDLGGRQENEQKWSGEGKREGE